MCELKVNTDRLKADFQAVALEASRLEINIHDPANNPLVMTPEECLLQRGIDAAM